MKTQKYWVLVVVCLLMVIQAQAQEAAPQPITIGETFRIVSKKLNEQREIRVYLPDSYTSSKQRYPVIYTLDGEGTGSATANAVRFMTGYAAIPQMPEALVVAIPNTDRNRDMPIPQQYGRGGEANFLAFLADELIPAIEQHYRTQSLRILLGHSQGGLFAHYALTARPNVFQWVLSMDAPLAGFAEVKPMLEKAKTIIRQNPNYRGRLVTIENLYGWKKEWASLVESAAKGFYGERVEIKDETHETMAYKGIYEGLKRLFHDYAPNLVHDNKGSYTLPVLDERYKALSEAYGYTVDIPKPVLLMAATENVAMQNGAEAVEMVKRAMALYGESPTAKRLLADAGEIAKKGRDPRLAEWAKLPPPSVEQMQPFLGVWRERKGEFEGVLTFAVKNGIVHAQFDGFPPGSEPFQLEISFVRVLGGKSLQWGVRNGRGPGIMVHTATLADENTLTGTTEGVGFIHTPPSGNFTYKRQISDKKSSPDKFDEIASFTRVSYSVPQRPQPWDKRKELPLGTAAPDWQLQTVDGKTVRLSELRGEVVVLDFWAHWCEPCRKLEPLFDQLKREYESKPVEFFTVSIWADRTFTPQAFLSQYKPAATFLIGTDAVGNDYGIWGIPTYFVIDATGKISYLHMLLSVDAEALKKRLHSAIEQALNKE